MAGWGLLLSYFPASSPPISCIAQAQASNVSQCKVRHIRQLSLFERRLGVQSSVQSFPGGQGPVAKKAI